jgi:hypothetical protein
LETTGTKPIEDKITNCQFAIIKTMTYGNMEDRDPYWTIDVKMIHGDCQVRVDSETMYHILRSDRCQNILKKQFCIMRQRPSGIYEFAGFV